MDTDRSRFTQILGALAAMVLLVAPGLSAQTGSVAGRITDATSGQAIPAAQVFIADMDIGVLSQQNGSYIMLNVPVGTHTVTVQRIGYREVSQDVTVAAGETVVADFRISEEALQLDEVIVTGTPGGTQRRAIGNTVASVDVSDVVQDVAVSNFQDLLGGRTPGLQFVARNGNVGTGSPITIRGAASFDVGRNRPLIYVDGVRVNNDMNAGPLLGESGGAGNPGQVNTLDDFNPEDIESIEIIKGPAAASLYGTEASAGVIQIITKKGQEGAPEFNISIREGVNYMRDPAGRLGTMYTCPVNPQPGYITDSSTGQQYGCPNASDLTTYNMYDEANAYIASGYFPWPTKNLYQNGLTQNYNVDVRGGTQAVRYFLSANYDNNEGNVWYNTDEAMKLRGNVGVVFDEHISLDMSTGYIDGSTRFASATVGDGDVWQDMIWSNGYYLDRITPFGSSGNCPDSKCLPNVRLGGFQEHLPSDVAKIDAKRDYSRFTGSATLNFQSGDLSLGGNLTGSLTSRAVVGIDKGWDTNSNLYPRESGIVPSNLTQYTTSWSPVYDETVTGKMVYARPITTNYSFDYSLTADVNVGSTWSFASSAGAQYYTNSRDFFQNTGQGFASVQSTTINQLSQAQIITDYSLVENKSLGFYVQEEVGWNDRIFVTGAVRFDDNSTFGVDAPAQKYPKVSATWVVSEESFWNFDFINSLRLRGAWGKAGRQPSSTAGQNIYVAMTGPGGAAAIRPSSPGNPGIQPEVSKELELGADFALLNDRISGEFTHYSRNTHGELLGVPVLSSFGFPGTVDRNLGQIDSWGWEARLSARLYESDAFTFDLDLSGDYTNNEIKDLGGFVPASTGQRVGLPYPNIITNNWVVSGTVDPNGAFANAYGVNMSGMCDSGVSLAPAGATPGEAVAYGKMPGGTPVDCNTNRNERIFAGNGFATHTFSVAPRIGLLGNQLQIFALAQGEYGRVRNDNGHAWGQIYNNGLMSRIETDPVWVVSDRLSSSGFQWTKDLYNADFWKLREIGVRYTLPSSLVERTGASRASLAFSMREPWTIWTAQDNISGVPISDPEFGDPTGLDGSGNYYSLPPLTSIDVTLRVTF